MLNYHLPNFTFCCCLVVLPDCDTHMLAPNISTPCKSLLQRPPITVTIRVTATAAMAHPYYPLTAHIPSYAQNEMDIMVLGPFFVVVLLAIMFAAFVKACKVPLRPIDRFAASWFALCTVSPKSWGFLY